VVSYFGLVRAQLLDSPMECLGAIGFESDGCAEIRGGLPLAVLQRIIVSLSTNCGCRRFVPSADAHRQDDSTLRLAQREARYKCK
jgi:hypothetical protein